MKKQATPSPVLIDKEAFADEIEAAIPCIDECAVIVWFRRGYSLVDENNQDIPDTVGHTWEVDVGDISRGLWFDDRDGDIRLLIAKEFEKRGRAMLEYAKHLRQHAKEKPLATA